MKKNLKVLTTTAVAVVAMASLSACGGSATSATTAETKAESADANAESSESAETEKSADAKDAKADSADKKVLKVAMECAYAPYNWTQPDDSNGAVPIADSNEYAYGYDVMMAKKIADELGYDLQIVRLDWDSLIPAVQTGQVDCVIAGQSITKERQEAVDFTDPYYYASIVTLVKAGGKYENATSVADLAGATCTSQQSTIWYTVCLPQIQDANILSATASAPDMLMSLEADKCDIVVTDQPTGKGALVAYPDFKMLEFGGGDDDFQVSDEDINIGISLKKGNTELKDAINGVLATMDKNDYAKMMDEAISVQPLAN
ncbi:transporter substrate-binding domain-containing protein [Brotaphodocola catenula]|jgi:putative lysine transport system substrate-binding protein|uniref:Transporter substrate-binding domain-containing protein n=1 Tax=Brotaphodocola catenula TaxID=2885361 RepID=A0AAE3ANC0_9FIRM|nr:transporter substrate-binding domain-containing protein [Brotaphodocola catenula]MCC2163796.1 transporter substrate-binding domain-containing protein [Brotaphodocola catenula]